MARPDHYAVLGVSPEADAAEIRAAYVYLLKRYHPDKAGADEDAQDSAQVQRIVAAYKILKDPDSRARYDAARRRLEPLPSAVAEAARRGRKIRRRTALSLKPDERRYAMMAAAGLVGLVLVSAVAVPKATHRSRPPAARASPARNIPSPEQLQGVIREAAFISAGDAANFSRRCFEAARQSPNPVAADLCVGFDAAYVDWREPVTDVIADPYFQPDALMSRARGAFGRLSPVDADARVESIGAATFEALLRASPVPEDPSAVSTSDNQVNSAAAADENGVKSATSKPQDAANQAVPAR